VSKLVGAESILRQLQYLPVSDAIDDRPEVVSSAHWGDVPTISADIPLLQAMLKLLETNAPALAIHATNNNSETPEYITLTSINRLITRTRHNESKQAETAI
jgi:osmoprotectant transport system ATP-binding protein